MKNQQLEIDGIQLNYYVCGNKNGPVLILLHGLAASAFYSFTELMDILSEKYSIIAIDQPGHGKSTPFESEQDYLYSNLAGFYEKAFRELVNEPFYLLGHSWGADVALHYARWYPDGLKGVILLDGGFTFPDFQEEMTFSRVYNAWDKYMDNTKFDTWEEAIEGFKGYANKWNSEHEHGLQSIFVKNERYELAASKFTALSIIKAFFEEPFSSLYAFIKVPLLLIHATEPKDLESARIIGISRIKKDVENATVVSVNGAGHMVQWDEPQFVAEEIVKWIEKESV